MPEGRAEIATELSVCQPVQATRLVSLCELLNIKRVDGRQS